MSDPADVNALRSCLAESAWLAGLARRLVVDPADADDLVQDAWVAALRRPPAPEGALRGWLATVVRRGALQRRRSGSRRHAREAASARPEALPSAGELSAEADAQAAVARAVVELSHDERELVLLHFYRGVSLSEIARRRGEPRTTVSGRLDAALAALRRRLTAEHGGDDRAWVVLLLPLAESAADRPVAVVAPTTASIVSKTTAAVLASAVLAVTALVALDSDDAAEPSRPAIEASEPGQSVRAIVDPVDRAGAPARPVGLAGGGGDRVVFDAARPSAPGVRGEQSEIERSQLTIVLVDEAGLPIEAEARVRLLDSERDSHELTGRDGPRFDVTGVDPGNYTVIAEAVGYRHVSRRVELNREPAVHDLVLELAPSWIVEICLRDTDGVSLAQSDAETLELYRGGFGRLGVAAFRERPATADPERLGRSMDTPNLLQRWNETPVGREESDGHWSWIDLFEEPPLWIVLAYHGLELDARWLEPGVDRLDFVVDCDLLERSVGALHLRVVDGPSGDPIANASVILTLMSSAQMHDTDQNGEVRVGALAPGPYALIVHGAGIVLPNREVLIEPGETTDLGDLVIAETAVIAGRLVDRDGHGVSGSIEVNALGADPSAIVNVSWQADGSEGFIIRRPPSVVSLRGRAPAIGGRTQLSAPRLVDSTGGPVEGIELVLAEAAVLEVQPPPEGASGIRVGLWTAVENLPAAGGRFRGDEPLRLEAVPGIYRLSLTDGSGTVLTERTVNLPAAGATVRL